MRLALLLALSIPSVGLAWGEDGHVAISRIADNYLSATARAAIKDLLDGRPISDPRVCIWADEIRRSAAMGRKYKNHDRWHYINVDLGTKEADFKPDPKGDHVISAIERFRKVMADPAVSKEDRKEALMFVIHFVEDLHQPLHCCHRNDDRGGNLQMVASVNGRPEKNLNLHWFWDSHLVRAERGNLTTEDFATRLHGEITDDERKKWSDGDVKAWVWDGHMIAAKTVYQFANGTSLPDRSKPGVDLTDDNYIKANRPIVREQLKKAGVRLAKVLNDAFDRP